MRADLRKIKDPDSVDKSMVMEASKKAIGLKISFSLKLTHDIKNLHLILYSSIFSRHSSSSLVSNLLGSDVFTTLCVQIVRICEFSAN
jgi:hypothetical protein